MFPKMRSLQLFSLSLHAQYEIIRAFSGHTFPSVKLLTVKAPIHTLAQSFPQVKSYYVFNFYSVFYYWGAIFKYGEAVTEIHGLVVPDKRTLASSQVIVRLTSKSVS